jgi:hypothetical protein
MKYLASVFFTIMLAGLHLPADSNFQDGINLLDQKIGIIKGHTLVYDEFDRREGYTGSVKVYYKTNKRKRN